MDLARAAITGGSGRLGRYVIDELDGCLDVLVVDRVPPSAGQPYVHADVLDLTSVRHAIRDCDAIVHLAALDYSVKAPPEDFMRTNVLGTWHVLQAAREAGVRRVVICSSTAAYGFHDITETTPLYLPVDEDHPSRPVHAYGLSKQLAETMAGSASRAGMSIICLRPALIAFPDVISEMRTAARDPSARRLFCYVTPEDVARAIRLALEVEVAAFGLFNICADDSYTAEPTLAFMERLYGPLPEIRRPEVYERNPLASVFDSERARNALGFTPSRRWSSVVAQEAG